MGRGMNREEAIAFAKEDMEHPAVKAFMDKHHSTGLLKQEVLIAQMHLYPNLCPNCQKVLPEVDATHIEGDHYECIHCGAKVRYCVPLFAAGGNWYWDLEPGQIPSKAG